MQGLLRPAAGGNAQLHGGGEVERRRRWRRARVGNLLALVEAAVVGGDEVAGQRVKRWQERERERKPNTLNK